MRTTLIIVVYNSSDILPEFIESIPKSTPCIFVDNASSDQGLSILKNHGFKPIENSNNEGFGRACNRGAEAAKTEFLLFINPDAILDGETINALEAAADENPSMVAANPHIFRHNGQISMKTRSTLIAKKDRVKVTLGESQIANMLSGCALFCRRDPFQQMGGFDPKIFLYHEDEDLALRFDTEPGALRWVHNAIVHHNAEQHHMMRSKFYFLTKHGKQPSRLLGFLRIILSLALPFNVLSKRQRHKFIGQFMGLKSTYKDGGAYLEP